MIYNLLENAYYVKSSDQLKEKINPFAPGVEPVWIMTVINSNCDSDTVVTRLWGLSLFESIISILGPPIYYDS